MKKLTIAILSISLVSCSNHLVKNNQQMRVTNGVTASSGMPNFYISEEFIPKKIKASRSIASKQFNNELNSFDNKKVYFLTLLGQYYRVQSLLGKNEKDLNVCPYFHHEILEQEKNIEKLTSTAYGIKRKDYVKAIYAPRLLPVFPELSLPINDNQNVYQYTSHFKNNETIENFVKVALEEHAQKNKSELVELCESGASDNYYTFENLLTHFSNKDRFNNSLDSLKAVLKIPVFANLFLLRSIDPNYVSYSDDQFYEVSKISKNYSIFEVEMLKRMDVSWVEEYFENLNKSNKDQFAFKSR